MSGILLVANRILTSHFIKTKWDYSPWQLCKISGFQCRGKFRSVFQRTPTLPFHNVLDAEVQLTCFGPSWQQTGPGSSCHNGQGWPGLPGSHP